MSALKELHSKFKLLNDCKSQVELWKNNGEKIVFTNGCFDLLHQGHLHYLARAKDLGSKLVIGLNSDASVKRLKGASRPINDELSRAKMLSSLFFVDAVVLFEEDTPLKLIEFLSPNILVKGGDYTKSTIVGAEFVESKGGKVEVLSFIDGFSTTNIVTRIQNLGLK